MQQYYYTGVSDQKLQYNKKKKKKVKKKEQSYFYHKTDIFYSITFMDVFIIPLPTSSSSQRFNSTISFFYNSMPLKAQVEK